MHIRTPIASYIIRTKMHTGRCNARKKEKKSNIDAIDRRAAADLCIYRYRKCKNKQGKKIFSSASQNVLKQATNWSLPGLTYVKEGRKDTLTEELKKCFKLRSNSQ